MGLNMIEIVEHGEREELRQYLRVDSELASLLPFAITASAVIVWIFSVHYRRLRTFSKAFTAIAVTSLT